MRIEFTSHGNEYRVTEPDTGAFLAWDRTTGDVMTAFVPAGYRGNGLAMGLCRQAVRAAAEHRVTTPHAPPPGTKLSEEGAALVRAWQREGGS